MKKVLHIWIIIFSYTNCITFACPCLPGEYCARNSENGCLPCEPGTYKQDKDSYATSCTSCRLFCGANENIIRGCSRTADIVCQCERGHYKSEDTNGECLPHKSCRPGYGVKTPGTPTSDTACEKCEINTYSSATSTTDPCKPCTICPYKTYEETVCTAYKDTQCKAIDPQIYAHKERRTDPDTSISNTFTTDSNTTTNQMTTTTVSNTVDAMNVTRKSVPFTNITTSNTTNIHQNGNISRSNSEEQSTKRFEKEMHEILHGVHKILDGVKDEKNTLTTLKIITIVNCIATGVILIGAGAIILYRKRQLPCRPRGTDRIHLAEDFFPNADCHAAKFVHNMSPESSDEIRPVSLGAEENCDTTPTAAATSTADQTNNYVQPTGVYLRVKDTTKSSSLPPLLPRRQTEGGNILKRANTMPLQNELQINVNSLIQTGCAKNSAYTLDRAFTDLSHDLCGVQWEMFFRGLIGHGCDPILNRVKRNHDKDIREQIYQMLLEWERILAKNASLDLIVKELEDFGENLLADFYRKKLKDIVYA